MAASGAGDNEMAATGRAGDNEMGASGAGAGRHHIRVINNICIDLSSVRADEKRRLDDDDLIYYLEEGLNDERGKNKKLMKEMKELRNKITQLEEQLGSEIRERQRSEQAGRGLEKRLNEAALQNGEPKERVRQFEEEEVPGSSAKNMKLAEPVRQPLRHQRQLRSKLQK